MRIKPLDGLRGIAAISVVFFHYTFNYRQETSLPFNNNFDFIYGHYGVELFFIISGFVIYMTLMNVKSTREFFFKRFLRLYPVYWICLIVSYSFVSIFGLPGREVDIKSAFINLTMIQNLFGFKNIDGSYWSLFVELCFYAIIGLIFFLNKMKYILYWGGGVILGSIIYSFYPFKIGTFLILQKGYGALFFSGILFYKLYKKEYSNIYLIHSFILISLLTIIFSQRVSYGEQFNPIIIIIPYILFYLFVLGKLEILRYSVFQFLGRISYTLYLLHLNVGYIIINYLLNEYSFQSPLLLVIPIILVVTLSWIITDFIEKPLIVRIKNIKAIRNIVFSQVKINKAQVENNSDYTSKGRL